MQRSRTPILALAITALAGCSELEQATEPPEPMQASAQAAADIFTVQARHTPGLMRRAGIIGTGVRQIGTTQSIVVYAVSPSHAAAARVPSRLDGYGVDVVVTGRIDAGDISNPTTRERPAPNGFSVGHPDITAGTIGARVKDAAGNVYILSNNHVLANSNNASIGDATLQPGPYDGGTASDQIGTLADFETIVMGGSANAMDAAISLVNGANLLGATPSYAYGAPGTSIVQPALNMGVQKFGRTTGHTHGVIAEVNLTVSVCYVPRGPVSCAQAATFTNQIGITPGTFSAGGDSGSLIVTDDAGRNPVGLLFAGSSTRTIANRIGPVLSRFGVAIDPTNDGTGDPPPPPSDEDTPPAAAFAYSCGNSANCSFTDQSSDDNGVVAWSWSFSDGGTATSQNTSHTFGSAGTHTVTLTVTDSAGQSDTASRTVSCSVRGRLRCS